MTQLQAGRGACAPRLSVEEVTAVKAKALAFLGELYRNEDGSDVLEYAGLTVLALIIAFVIYKVLRGSAESAAGSAANALTGGANELNNVSIH